MVQCEMTKKSKNFIRISNVAGEGHRREVPISSNLRTLEEEDEEERYGQPIGDELMEEGSGLF